MHMPLENPLRMKTGMKTGLKPLLNKVRWVSFDLYETLVEAGTRDLVFYLEQLTRRLRISMNINELLSIRERIVRDVSRGPFITIKERDAKVIQAIHNHLSIDEPVEPAVDFLYQKYFNCPLFDDENDSQLIARDGVSSGNRI